MFGRRLKRFFAELRRRHVWRVAAFYAVVGWLLVEVASTTFPLLRLPDWAPTLVLALVLLGFPVALILAWALEVTPEGVRRTEPAAETGEGSGGVPPAAGLGLLVFAFLVLGGWGAWWWGFRDDAARDEIRSLAVLPLDNLTGDPGQDYFVDGMHDALISELAKLEGLSVLSRTSTLRYRESDLTASQIAAELRVDGLVEGSIFKAGDSVRVTAQLIRAEPESHLWTESYEGDLRHALALHSRVARSIADEVRLALSPAQEARLAEERAVDPAAQEAYLRGRALWRTRRLEALERALDYLEEAVLIDPGFAQGWAGLADGYVIIAAYTAGDVPLAETERLHGRSEEAGLRALELDPDLAEAHAALGFTLLLSDLAWDDAEASLRRAIRLNPSYAQAHDWLADLLVARGDVDGAVAAMERAVELDPFSPLMNRDLGRKLAAAGRCDEAERYLRTALDLDPAHLPAYMGLMECAEDPDAKMELLLEMIPLMPGEWSEGASEELRRTYRDEGWPAVQERLSAGGPGAAIGHRARAMIELGRFDDAVEMLWEGYRARVPTVLFWARSHPGFEPLEDHPGYRRLLEEMGPGD